MPRPGLPALTLVAANLVPLLGVLFLGWSLGEVMLLFWLESAVVGFYNVLRMLASGRPSAIPLVLFFLLHYGIFMAVHLLFLLVLFVGGDAGDVPGRLEQLLLPALALVASHGVAFHREFLRDPEARARPPGDWMAAPYPRIVLMHLTILGGGWLLVLVGTPTPALALLVVLKIGLDLGLPRLLDRRPRRPRAPAPDPRPPERPATRAERPGRRR